LEIMEKEARELGLVKNETDVVTYALFPQVAVKFLKGEIKEEPLAELKLEKGAAAVAPALPTEFKVEVNGDIYDVRIIQVGQTEIKEIKKAEVKPKNVEGGVISAMQGTVLKLKVKVGDFVKTGDIVAVLEAMKMQNDVRATTTGVVKEIFVNEGDSISQGDVLMTIK